MVAYDDHGNQTGSVDFDYDAVDENLATGFLPEAAQHPNARAEASLVPAQRLSDWVIQKVPKNRDGIEIRATIVAWKILPHLRSKSLTDIAAMIGRDKQSVGRWHDDFKRTFGTHIKRRT